jgi:hypothetical protein
MRVQEPRLPEHAEEAEQVKHTRSLPPSPPSPEARTKPIKPDMISTDGKFGGAKKLAALWVSTPGCTA